MLQLHIPKPCNEDWSGMKPEGDGRFCNSCSRIVVDFSNMADAEVQNYLLQQADQRVCGRFKKSQLQAVPIEIPEQVFHQPMPLWKQFLAASLVAFSMLLFSCETRVTTGAAASQTPAKLTSIAAGIPAIKDIVKPVPPAQCNTLNTVFAEGEVVGELAQPKMIIGEPPMPEVTMGVPLLIDTPVKAPDTPAKKPPCANDSTIIF